MTSILLSIMPFIAILITPGEATTQITDNYSSSNSHPLPLNRGKCPTIESKDFDGIYYSYTSKYESCATLEYEITSASSDTEKEFYVMFGRSNHLGQRSCIFDDDHPSIMFTCASHSSSPLVDLKTGGKIVRLYGRVMEETFGYEIRCAMYKNVEGVMNLMAISGNKSCEGLPQMLHNPMSSFPPGYVLLYPSLPRRVQKRSTSDNKNEMKTNYSGSRFFWRTG